MNRGTARYPLLEIDLDKLKANLAALIERCQSLSVEVAGVVKGFSALPEAAGVYTECGVRSLASSRLSQLRALRGAGVACERVLIRIPMLSELPEVAEVADMSLQSELETLRALNAVCAKRGTRHRVILMADLGDLREGFWSREELVDAALEVEYKLDHLELAGVGTNLGCYGSVAATPEKLRELVSAAEAVERAIGRELQYISGGASTWCLTARCPRASTICASASSPSSAASTAAIPTFCAVTCSPSAWRSWSASRSPAIPSAS